jgi:putative endopeptidase
MKRNLILVIMTLFAAAAWPSTTASPELERYLNSFVDTSVSPRDDFFRYACGKWLHDNPIPANERSWGVAHVVQ